MWASNKLEVPVLGNLLMPCNVLVLFRRGKEICSWSYGDVCNRLAFVPALSHSCRFMTPFVEGELGKFRRDHVAYHCFPLEVLFNCSFSFILYPWLRCAHSTSLQPGASQPWSWGKATHEMKMNHRTSCVEPMLLIGHSLLLTPWATQWHGQRTTGEPGLCVRKSQRWD